MANQVNCANSGCLSLYRKMRTGGISDKTIDASDGNADGVIHCEGIVETALTNAERYGKYVEKITGRKVSWLFAERTKRAVNTVAGMAKNALLRQGYRPGEREYKRQLASAMFAFALAPAKKQGERIAYYNGRWLHNLYTLPFLDMGMAQIAHYLKQHGGLGLINPPEKNEFEATAEEFLANGRGLCTVRSKVLYAVFDIAGLKPFFAEMRPEDYRKNWPKMLRFAAKSPPPAIGDYFGGHIFVGIMVGDDPLYVEPNMPFFDVDYDEYARPISLGQMHQADMANLISDIRNHNNEIPKGLASAGATVERLIEGALAIGDSSELAFIFMAEGAFHSRMNDHRSAIGSFETALKFDPEHTQAAIAICVEHEQSAESETAKACYEKLPDDAALKAAGLANYYMGKKEYDRAREFIKKAVELGTGTGMTNRAIAASYIEEQNYGMAEEYLRKATANDPSSFLDAFLLADVLVKQEKWQTAAEAIQGALALNGTDPDALLNMTQALIKLGRTEDARRYAVRYFISLSMTADALQLSDERLFGCAQLAESLGAWRELAGTAGTLWNSGMRTLPVVIIMAEAECRIGQMGNTATLFETIDHIAGSIPPLPHGYFKHLSAIADCSGLWAELTRCCMRLGRRSAVYNIHMLYAAVKSGEEALIKEAADKAMKSHADNLSKFDPKIINLDVLDEVHGAISKMPRGIGSHPLIKPVFATYLATIAKIYRANGRHESAQKAERQAGYCGAKGQGAPLAPPSRAE